MIDDGTHSTDIHIHGPLEAVLTLQGIPYKKAVTHMLVVSQLIGNSPDVIPRCGSDVVEVVMEVGNYSLGVQYEYTQGYGYYTCYGAIGKYLIVSVHCIRGLGNLLSIVQMVRDYCGLRAPCYTCWYGTSNGKYCGLGHDTYAGRCDQHLRRDSV